MSNSIPGFSDDVESDHEDFNPQAAIESDNEDDLPKRNADPASVKDEGSPKSAADYLRSRDDDDDKPKVNGSRKRRRSQDDEAAEDEPEADGESADDEDAEGPGEDLGNGENDDDDDEEEENDEEEAHGHRRKRHKRDRRNQFIDVEAEVEDEDEEDADEDEDAPGEGFVADIHPEDELLDARAAADERGHRELDIERQRAEDLDAEAQAEKFRQRYGRNQAAASGSMIIPQRLLLPSVEDPTIWGVRCKQNKEREVVMAICKRVEDKMFTADPLRISSAFERGGTMSGYVYIEARRQTDVMNAVEGITNCYARTKFTLVPINEMPDTLRTQKSKSLDPGMYVRVKRGKYQGDLAQVEEVETNGLEVECRLVPRLDYGLNEDSNGPVAASNDPSKRKRPGAFSKNSVINRPPQRLFSDYEAKKKHSKFLTQQTSYHSKEFQYMGERYVSGFLIKTFKIQYLQTEDVNPKLEEVTRFTAGADDGTENLDLNALAQTLKQNSAAASYLPGDSVEIYQGEQRGVFGKAVSVHGDIVTLRVTEGDLRNQSIEAPVKTLRKRFREGDHVKVVGGSKYQDEVGMVVRVKDDRVTLLSDANNQEITVFSKDLRAAADSAITHSRSKYDLHDLVQLDPATVGVVTKVDRESFKVLDQSGTTRTLLPTQIATRLERRRHAVATDREGTEIRLDDAVRETGGEQRQGRVVYIHRTYIFVMNRQQHEDAGMWVARSSGVVVASKKAESGPNLMRMAVGPAGSRGLNGNSGTGPNGSAMEPPPKPPPMMGRDRILEKFCSIRRGPYKGLMGIVRETGANDARIELHGRSKIINVPKAYLIIKDPMTGQPIDMSKVGGPPAATAPKPAMPANGGGTRPAWANTGGYGGGNVGGGGRTPGWAPNAPSATNGAATPGWGRTPGWAGANSGGGMGGARTPGWKPGTAGGGGGGGRTPAGASGWGRDSGGMTSYGGGAGGAGGEGGRTSYGMPTWNPSASTPFHPSSFGSGANDGSRTPAAFSAASAPTPGGFNNADTPGAGKWDDGGGGGGGGGRTAYGGVSAYGGPAAYTPRTGATPGGFAETPAGGGGDEGYE